MSMCAHVVRSSALAIAGCLALLLVAAPAIVTADPMATQPASIIVGTGVYFQPSESWADIHFSAPQTFSSQVRVGPRSVTFDRVTFGVEKTPTGTPRADVLLTTWAPEAADGEVAIQIRATSEPNTQVSFHVTGLRANAYYRVSVDGIGQTVPQVPGQFSLAWSSWSTRTIDVVTQIDPSLPVPDYVAPGAVSDLRVAEWGPDYAVLEWTAPGDDGVDGIAGSYDVRIGQVGPLTGANFASAQVLPAGAPRAAGTTERLSVTGLASNTRYWFALRSADEVPNWSPISNGVEVLTLSGAVEVTTVNGILIDSDQAELQVFFSGPMNRSSVERALEIQPQVSYGVDWANDEHLVIRIQTPLVSAAAYRLIIAPHATDGRGVPLARTYTYGFAGPVAAAASIVFVIVVLVSLAGLIEGLVLVSVLFARNKKKMRLLQDVISAQLIRAHRMGERVRNFGNERLLQVAARPGRRKPSR